MGESWRTYVSFVLVGAIFVVCQALSGGVTGNQPEGFTAEPGDSTYRDVLRVETAGSGGMIMSGDIRPLLAAPSAVHRRLAANRLAALRPGLGWVCSAKISRLGLFGQIGTQL